MKKRAGLAFVKSWKNVFHVWKKSGKGMELNYGIMVGTLNASVLDHGAFYQMHFNV